MKIRIRKRKIRNWELIVLLVFLFLPVTSFGADYETLTGYNEWEGEKIINKEIDIDEEATLLIKKGTVIKFENGGYIYNAGKLIAKGTVKEPVIFTSSDSKKFNIYSGYDSEITIKNAQIKNGGIPPTRCDICDIPIMSKGGPAITIYDAKVDIEEVDFRDNIAAISITAKSDDVKITRSKFLNNKDYDIEAKSINQTKLNFKNNWWGNANGPEKDSSGKYKKVKGDADVKNWSTKEVFHDPVIIVPGIFGSFEKDGIMQIDPMIHVYDNLYAEFTKNGYVSEMDVFTFPYNWRNSNVDNAILLKEKINQIKSQTNWPKVDIVAHSMGGLLARQYIESENYGDDIDQLITIGTPHLGAPESYLAWEAGEETGIIGMVMKKFLSHEAEEANYESIFDYIRKRPIVSFKELLPVYTYLFDAEEKHITPILYPNRYPINDFLESLNTLGNVKKLSSIEFSKITGKIDSPTSTVDGFNVIDANLGEKWEHGYPLGFEIIFPKMGDRGLIKNFGDGTVPIYSAKSEEVPSDEYIELNSSHKDLPTDAQKDVLEILTGIRPTEESKMSLIEEILFVRVFSPIDIQIISPSGKKYGKDFETGKEFESIGGSYYSGFDTDTEFITIPNPENGEYKIITQGTGEGGYKIEVSKVNEEKDETKESTAVFEGNATKDVVETMILSVQNDEVISPEQKDGASSEIINPTLQESQTVSSSNNSSEKEESDTKDERKKENKNILLVMSNTPFQKNIVSPRAGEVKTGILGKEKAVDEKQIEEANIEKQKVKHPFIIVAVLVFVFLILFGYHLKAKNKKTSARGAEE